MSSSGSAEQLRREAAKARKLADNAFGEAEKGRLLDVAASLDREAAAMETALAVRAAKASADRSFRTIRSIAASRLD
ncbi:hypothetical protein [Sphingomonas sp. Root50]|uniref:hypothetical protein n=1 Tax=Sphingomonas sp. Root50 TaxID=1736551 RepID=UPI000A914566|nr:hypothetical protein [Sphingomonas sp. Root50]